MTKRAVLLRRTKTVRTVAEDYKAFQAANMLSAVKRELALQLTTLYRSSAPSQ
jgi:hypothetical protein